MAGSWSNGAALAERMRKEQQAQEAANREHVKAESRCFHERWRTCRICGHRWLDKSNKADCVNCEYRRTPDGRGGFLRSESETKWSIIERKKRVAIDEDVKIDELLHGLSWKHIRT